jgi:carbon-monoxide dehydrogenase medium subunit
MIPATFDYVRAQSLDEAVALLAKHGDNAKLLAGGHSLIPAMKLRLAQPGVIIDIGRLREMSYIRQESGEIAIGALTTHHEVETSDLLRRHAPALAAAAAVLGDVQVRNRGTIGGALAHADPAADYPAVALALDCTFVVRGPGGDRTIAATDWFVGPFTSAMHPGEILREIRLPVGAPGSQSVYRKFVRRAADYGMTGVAVYLEAQGQMCQALRVGITCVGMTAYRAEGVEQALLGKALTPENIRAAAARAVDGIDVNADLYVDAEYRSHLCRVETARAIEDALAGMRG